MKFLIVFALCFLATSKVTLQGRFGKKSLTGAADAPFFNALVFLTAALLFSYAIPSASAKTWLFALFFSVFTVLFQLFYTYALSRGNVSLTVVMINLSMLFPVLVSSVVYDEPLSVPRLLGIALTVLSFVLCVEKKPNTRLSGAWFFCALVAMLANGAAGVTQKVFGKTPFAVEKEAFVACTYLLAFVITAVVCLTYRIKKEKITVAKNKSCYLFAVSAGGVLALFQWLNTYAISTMDGTFLYPVYAGGSIVMSSLVGRFLFGDALTKKQTVSIFIGILAIVLMNF